MIMSRIDPTNRRFVNANVAKKVLKAIVPYAATEEDVEAWERALKTE